MKKCILCSMMLVFLLGCGAKGFGYKPDEMGVEVAPYQLGDVHLRILPMIDNRADKTSTEGWSWLAFLPLVPFMPYHNYDLQSYSADAGRLEFDSNKDLVNAMVQHFRYSGMSRVSTVDLSRSCLQYSLQPELRFFGVEGNRTMYCLGLFPGCYLALLGAPFNYSTSYMILKFTLRNPNGTVILEKEYKAQKEYIVGEYYNWSPFKFVGFNLAKIMNQASEDITQAVINDNPDVINYNDENQMGNDALIRAEERSELIEKRRMKMEKQKMDQKSYRHRARKRNF